MIFCSRGRLRACPRIFFLLSFFLTFFPSGCKPPETATVRAIIGAVLVDGTGGPPISNSVVLISGSRVAMAGARVGIVIPQGAEEIDGTGKFMVPGIVNLYGSRAELGVTTLGRIRVLDARAPGVEEQARGALARVSTLADARRLVAAGVTGFIGMIRDTESIEPGFIARMRDLRTVWAPMLSALSGEALEVAKRNTKRLAEGRVTIAVASGAAPVMRELELLQEAGIAPGDVVVAATRNGAVALGRPEEVGTITVGKRADLVMAVGNPVEDIRNFRPERVMVGGEFVNTRDTR